MITELLNALKQYTDCVLAPGDVVEIRRLPSGRSTWHRAADLTDEQLAETLKQENGNGDGIYVGANPRQKSGGTKNDDVVLARCLFSDFDNTDWPSVKERLGGVGLPEPTLVISSGHGVHCYWRLQGPITDMAEWSNLQRRLIATVGSDKAIHDPARIMRLPGFINHKEPVAPCEIIKAAPHRTYCFADLVSHFKELPEPPYQNTTNPATAPSQNTGPEDQGDSLTAQGRATLAAAKWPGVGEGQRNSQAYHHAAYLVKDFGLSKEQARGILVQWNAKNSPPLPEEELQKCLESAVRHGKHPVGLKANQPARPIEQPDDAWDPPVPLGQFDLPKFPVEAFPGPLCVLCKFCVAVAESFQVPIDLPALPILTVGGAALAKKVRVHVKGDWYEPVNIYTVTALEPANRKSAVFRAVTEVMTDYEQAHLAAYKDIIRENQNQRDILEKRLADLRKKAAKAETPADVDNYRLQAEDVAKQLSELPRLVPLRLLADDITPEKLVSLMQLHHGRVAIMSPEGDLFDMMAGRYSNGVSNFGVYLKGHDGDDIRVDRVNLERLSEFVRNPALSIGLTVQPDVLNGLVTKPGFRGRGLLGRFLYSIPQSPLGHRHLNPTPVPPPLESQYRDLIWRALELKPSAELEGEWQPHIIDLSPEALEALNAFQGELEPMLGAAGELHAIADWAGKLAGAVVRIAGIFHGLIHVGAPSQHPIDQETMVGAIVIGQYLLEHAKAAFFVMGSDPATEIAQRVLNWLKEQQRDSFTRRDVFNGIRGRVQKVDELDGPLDLLERHGFMRPVGQQKIGPGRKPSQKYDVNPIWLAQNTQNTHNSN